MKSVVLKEYSLLSENEHKKLLDIRNSDEIRIASINEDKIQLKDHLSWVRKLKDDKTKQYFAIICDNKIIGGVNIFDIYNKIKWGIFFTYDASLMIKSMVPIYFIDYIFGHFKCEFLYAEIKKSNQSALSYNKNLGFKKIEEDELVIMRLQKSDFLETKNSKVLKRIVKKMSSYIFEMEFENGRKN